MKNILITRPANKNSSLKQLLSDKKLKIFTFPLIETVALKENNKIRFKSYDFTILTSGTTIDVGHNILKTIELGKILTVGVATAEKAKKALLKDIYFPSSQSNIEGIKDFLYNLDLNNKRILSPGGLIRIGELEQFLISKGAVVDMPIFYETKKIVYNKGYLKQYIQENNINGIVLCSPSAVYSLLENICREELEQVELFSLGTSTHKSLIENRLQSVYTDGTLKGLVGLIRSFYDVK